MISAADPYGSAGATSVLSAERGLTTTSWISGRGVLLLRRDG